MTSHDPLNLTILGPNGSGGTISQGDLLARLHAARRAVVAPFAEPRVDLVARVSEKLLGRGGGATSSFVKHFAFWIRRGALQKLAANFEKRLPPQSLARPRGLVFHLPPQNVETVFLYSWILSYLVGNANVTRVPTDFSDAIRAVCELFLERLQAAGDDTQVFVHYDSSSALSAVISAESDARVVWGGDAKVAAFAPLPLRNGGKAIWFGDRSSFSVMKGEALRALDDGAREALARRLYNDVFIFDQMACSSPHVLFVVGDPARDETAVTALMASLARVALAAGQTAGTGHFMRKMVAAYQAAASRRRVLAQLAQSGADERRVVAEPASRSPCRRRLSLGGFRSVDRRGQRHGAGARPDGDSLRLWVRGACRARQGCRRFRRFPPCSGRSGARLRLDLGRLRPAVRAHAPRPGGLTAASSSLWVQEG